MELPRIEAVGRRRHMSARVHGFGHPGSHTSEKLRTLDAYTLGDVGVTWIHPYSTLR